MPTPSPFVRPSFGVAVKRWQALLADRKLPTDLLWVFEENLCFERTEGKSNDYRVGFQTRLTPPPPDAARIAFDYFAEFEARTVFYRLGTAAGKSVCAMLCDEWFESRGEKEGFIRQDEWLMSFFPGSATEVEEILDEERWTRRVVRDRGLHDLDFTMRLRAVHEILAHGRVLTSYEHYALKFLHAWRRLVGEERSRSGN